MNDPMHFLSLSLSLSLSHTHTHTHTRSSLSSTLLSLKASLKMFNSWADTLVLLRHKEGAVTPSPQACLTIPLSFPFVRSLRLAPGQPGAMSTAPTFQFIKEFQFIKDSKR